LAGLVGADHAFYYERARVLLAHAVESLERLS
jgi:hypothetical protein